MKTEIKELDLPGTPQHDEDDANRTRNMQARTVSRMKSATFWPKTNKTTKKERRDEKIDVDNALVL